MFYFKKFKIAKSTSFCALNGNLDKESGQNDWIEKKYQLED